MSLLYGLGPDHVADEVRTSHDAAAKDAVRYLERHTLYARRGSGGEQRIETTGALAAAFRHRTSRAGDPQLHTHVLVANVVEGSDGRFSAPDARLIYFHGRTAGFVYQAVLRAELSARLGVRFEPTHNGFAEIEGMDKSILALLLPTLTRRVTHAPIQILRTPQPMVTTETVFERPTSPLVVQLRILSGMS